MKHLRTIVLSSVLAIAFTACGGGGGSSSGGEADDTIIHNGVEYKTVTSPYTGRVWLDRNLGAAEVCESYDDVACYGDYYQWGRDADGHEDGTSATTTTLASSITPGHDKFIKTNGGDWVANGVDDSGAARAAKWSKTDGSSICPAGFRVPTWDELKAELLYDGSAEIQQTSSEKSGNSDDSRVNAFNSFLKLPAGGKRKEDDATGVDKGSFGYLWSIQNNSGNYDSTIVGWTDYTIYGSDARAAGLNVRCIKE
jgi:uncharacterized protein (TIGR02145 family)